MIRFPSHFLFVLIQWSLSSLSFAGWGGVGGGGLLQDGINPWFLERGVGGKDAPEVTYCLRIGKDFANSQEQLEGLVDSAITYWKEEFRSAWYPDYWDATNKKKFQVRVKTTGFRRIECNDTTDVDLSFQFGMLTSKQTAENVKENVDFTKFIAVTIRTDYSRETLRGKGFIYVSPDHGDKRFIGQNTRENPWTDSNGNRLLNVLIHELGHVHGIQHHGHRYFLMNQAYPETLVSKEFGDRDFFYLQPGTVFYPEQGTRYSMSCRDCNSTEQLRTKEFFGIPNEYSNAKIDFAHEQITVYASTAMSDHMEKIGSAFFPNAAEQRREEMITIWIPKEQTVYPIVRTILSGPRSVALQNSGIYKSEDGSIQRPVFYQLTTQYLQMGGVMDGMLFPNVLPQINGYGGPGWTRLK